MDKEIIIEKAIKKIGYIYQIIFGLVALAAVAGYFLVYFGNIQPLNPKSQASTALSTFLILYLVISIPFTLWLFYKNTQKWMKIDDFFVKIKKYETGSKWRTIIIGMGLVLSVVVFYFVRNQSTLYCAGIAAIGLIFTKPTIKKIYTELDIEEDE